MPRIEKTVFISYRRTNFWTALAIFQNLHANGYDVFFDYKSIPSGDFEQVIIENIKSRAHFLVLLTPSALERCSEPGDWLRREIETAIAYHRNIIPLTMESFDFGSPATVKALSGELENLKKYNALGIPAEYFEEAMIKLRGDRFLNRPLESVFHPVSEITRQVTEEQKNVAADAHPVQPEQLTAEEWFERAYVLQQSKNLEEAFRCYSEAIKLDPNLDIAYNNLGNVLTDLQRYEEAEAAYRKAIELDPADATAYSNLGILLKDLQRYEEAEAAYRKAIELDPAYATAYYNLGNLLRVTERAKEALLLWEKLIQITLEDFNPYLGIASVRKAGGESVPPDILEKAHALMPEDDLYNRACLESVSHNIDSAFAYLQKAAKQEGFDPSWAWQDPNLQWLRGDPRFAEIIGPKP